MATKNWAITKDAYFQQGGVTMVTSGSQYRELPVFWTASGPGFYFRSFLQFALDWSGVVQITKAELHIRTLFDYPAGRSKIRKITSSWAESSGGEPSTLASPEVDTGVLGSAGWKVIDITSIVNRWAPVAVKQSDGSPGLAETNYGIRLAAFSEAVSTYGAVFLSRESAYDPYIVLTYSTNRAPTAPSLTSPANGGIVSGVTPTFTFTGNDPDAGDTLSKYDIQVSTDNTFASVTHWNLAGGTSGISGQNVTRAYGGSALTRGTTYYWRARTYDAANATGAWSSTRSFKPNRLPTVSSRAPGSAALAEISNLSDLAIWTSGGSWAKPQMSFVFNDLDGQGMTKFRLRIYNDSAGSPGTQLYDSGEVARGAVNGATLTIKPSQAIVLGTQYWWSIDVYDGLEWAGESSKTAFKVRWAQGLYEFNPGASAAWKFLTGGLSASERMAAIFRSATSSGGDGATGKSAWKTQIGQVTVQSWVQVLVRLAAITAGTNSSLSDMTFSYIGAATTPDRWTTANWTVALDPDVRRYGSQALRLTSVGGSVVHHLYPYRVSSGDDVPVQPLTDYVFSAWVKTDGTLGTEVRLVIHPQGNLTSAFIASGLQGDDPPSATVDSSSYRDGWQRLVLPFTTPDGMTAIRPCLHCSNPSAGQILWTDGWQLEEGSVASQWRPGMVGDAIVLDVNGMMIDGQAGGIMRLRGSVAGARDLVELGSNGLLFGGDTPVYSPAAGVLRTDSAIRLNGDIELRRTGTDELTIDDAAGNSPIVNIGPAGTAAAQASMVLALNIERPWKFDQFSSGASSELRLRPTVDPKSFRITSADGAAVPLKVSADNNGGAVLIGTQFHLTGVISPTALAANTNDWNPTGLATCSVIRIGTDATPRTLSGIVASTDGRMIWLINRNTGTNIILAHDLTSTAANRFYCPGNANYTLTSNSSVLIIYDATSARWRVLGGVA